MPIKQTLPHFARIYGPENVDGYAYKIEIYFGDPITTKTGSKVNAEYVSTGKSFQFNYNKLRLAIAYAVSQGISQTEVEGFEDVPVETKPTASELPA